MKKIYEIINECNKDQLLNIINKKMSQEHSISDYKALISILEILSPLFNTILVSVHKNNNSELHFIRNNEIIFDEMEFFSLNEWLGMTISSDTIKNVSAEDIVSSILISIHNQSDEKIINYNNSELLNYLVNLNYKSLLEHHINEDKLNIFKKYIMRNN